MSMTQTGTGTQATDIYEGTVWADWTYEIPAPDLAAIDAHITAEEIAAGMDCRCWK